jgi:hypothetical protein
MTRAMRRFDAPAADCLNAGDANLTSKGIRQLRAGGHPGARGSVFNRAPYFSHTLPPREGFKS